MTHEFIKSLDWEEGAFFNNRQFYYLGKGVICIHMYNNICYMSDNDLKVNYSFIFTEKSLIEYTNIIKKLDEIFSTPKKFTVDVYLDTLRKFKEYGKV